jgi:hypothetical protein
MTLGSEESVRRYLTRSDGTTVGREAHERAQAMREAAQKYATAGLSAEDQRARLDKLREQQQQMSYRIAEAVVAVV